MKKSNLFRSAALSTSLLAALLAGCGGDKPEALIASGKEFIAKKDHKAAIIQLKNALQQNPELGEARFLLGKALLESGDAAGAQVELRKALEFKFDANQVVPLLARAMLGTGQARKVAEEFGKTELSSSEAAANLKTTLSVAYQNLGNREAASTALNAALGSQPDYAPAQLADARQKIANRDFQGAQAIIDGVLAKAADNYEALMLKGVLKMIQSDRDAALEAYRAAVTAKPDHLPAHSAVIAALLQQGKNDDAAKQLEAMKKVAPKHPQTIYLDTQLAYLRKDFKAARQLAQQLIKISPDTPNTLQIAGAIEYQLHSYIQSEAYLSRALQQAPDLPLARRLLVSNYLRTGQPAKALSTLTPALGKIDGDPMLLALAGQTYLQNGDAKKAEEYFAKASKLDPNDPAKRTSLALSHLAQGELSTGLNQLEEISASDKGTVADMALIATYLRRNELDKALKAIDSLDKKQPDNPQTYNLRARTLLGKNDIAGARKNFEKALSLNPAFLPAAASLALLDQADKKPDQARQRFEAVLASDPKNIGALLALADLKNNTGGKPEEVQGYLVKAVDANPAELGPRLALIEFHMRNKDLKKALSSAQESLAALPDKPELLDALGRLQQTAGESNQALATYGKLASQQPMSPLAHVRMAQIHLANKNKDEAGKSLRKALEIKPDLLEAQRGLALLALEAKKLPEALSIAREVQKQRPKEASGAMLEGDIHVAAKQWPEAAAAYRAGLKQAASPELAIKLHDALQAAGNKAETDKFVASWTREHPKDIAFKMHLGDQASLRKDFAGASQLYRSALDVQPNNAMVLNNLAWAMGNAKQPKALEYAEKANQLAPNQPPYMDTLAMLLADKGDTAKAIEILRKALAISPQASAIQFNLAKLLVRTGRKDEARTELAVLAKLGDKLPYHAEVASLQKDIQ